MQVCGSKKSCEAISYQIVATININNQFLNYQSRKTDDLFRGKHQTSAWPWYKSELKDDMMPIEFQEFQYAQISHQDKRLSSSLIL